MPKYCWIICFVFLRISVHAQVKQTGVTIHDKSRTQSGYVLFAPLFSKETFLIDRSGKIKQKWLSQYNPAQSVYLLDNLRLLRTGNDSSAFFFGGGGVIQIIDRNSKVEWEYHLSDSLLRQHHDVCPLPNGHILVLCWEKIPRAEAIAMGRNPDKTGKSIWSEKIIEIIPKNKNEAEVVWQWRLWDHLIQNFDSTKKVFGEIAQHPEKLDLNFLASKSEDWLHFNSLDYNQDLDQILISNRNLSEVYIIDHSTSTAEAASSRCGRYDRGGDLLFRWGNSLAYRASSATSQKLFRQHHATWIKKGLKDESQIMLFNNGVQRGGEKEYSEVLIINPQLKQRSFQREENAEFLPKSFSWSYTAPDPYSFFSFNVSSAQRLPNGNTLICEGAQGRFFEIDSNFQIVWEYHNPFGALLPDGKEIQNQVFRCSFVKMQDIGIQKSSKFLRKN